MSINTLHKGDNDDDNDDNKMSHYKELLNSLPKCIEIKLNRNIYSRRKF